jgi:hypothetical protein
MARVIDSTMLLAMLKLLCCEHVTANGSFGSNGQIPGFPTNFVFFALHQRSDRSRWTVKRTFRFRDTADPWYPRIDAVLAFIAVDFSVLCWLFIVPVPSDEFSRTSTENARMFHTSERSHDNQL